MNRLLKLSEMVKSDFQHCCWMWTWYVDFLDEKRQKLILKTDHQFSTSVEGSSFLSHVGNSKNHFVMTIVMWICVHPYKATHFENWIAVSTSFHLHLHNTCGVWTNFAKTIRMNKIVKWATMLRHGSLLTFWRFTNRIIIIIIIICTTKTIVRIPVFWNKFGWPVTIIVMGNLMQNHKCNKWRMLFRFSKWVAL